MLIRLFFKKVDSLLCLYLGIERETVKPENVALKDGNLIITNTASHKRHVTKESWTDFSKSSVKQINDENLEKLGLAAGKAIAKKCVISFEEPIFKKSTPAPSQKNK
jgi:hypothetical protein